MISDDLFDYVKTISSREDFVRFVDFLNQDYLQNKVDWGNDTLGQFLGGMSGFANDIGGYYRNIGEDVDVEKITWRMAAEMLLAASVYGN